MSIKKPESMLGIPLDNTRRLGNQIENPSLIITNNIDPANYLKIPGSNFCIVKIEENWTKGYNYETSHKLVLGRGLQVPSPALFTSHLKNIINAYYNNTDVYQADGNKISRGELENIYNHLMANHIDRGAWTWLNARFVSGSGFNDLDLESITRIDSKENLINKIEPLEECSMKNCYVDLEFNKQGLALKRLDQQKPIKGKNIRFFHPGENTVAGFLSNLKWSCLGCNWHPGYSNLLLGVYCVCEGKR